ncbi:MAG TPA: hypothetical protein VHB79_17415 [Polyangiaceae bacterium]|nr:hypothetical protein [Polyangiaceae bacterium]
MVHADAPNPTGGYYDTSEFAVINPDGTENGGPCDAVRRPHGSRGFAVLNFECHPFTQIGVYTIRFEPASSGLPGDAVDLRLRVVDAAPKTPSAPAGWQTVNLTSRPPQLDCYNYGDSYVVALDHGALVTGPGLQKANLPAPLASRMSEDHARTVKYVFEADDGWIVMFDHGEFGGGIEWFARAGGQPRSVFVGPHDQDEFVPQNVNRALAADGVIYVLQGISHMGTSEGQLAKIWREHDHFTSHVIARYASEPVDWIRHNDGTWLIATWTAIWETHEGARSNLVAHLPDIISYPTSLVNAADGTLFVGTRGGVVRLSPTWPDAPRYAADFLWKPGSPRRDCHAVSDATE